MVIPNEWTKSGWKNHTALQQPNWPDQKKPDKVTGDLTLLSVVQQRLNALCADIDTKIHVSACLRRLSLRVLLPFFFSGSTSSFQYALPIIVNLP